MEWSNEVVFEFLDLYENEPVIWCAKHSDHKNRNAIYDAWMRIEDKISIQCSIKELKKKKESLMSTFRPLVNKVKATPKTGTDSTEVFKPAWFAYEKMASFLQGNYTPRNTQNTEELENVTAGENEIFEDFSDETDDFLTNEVNYPLETVLVDAQARPSNNTADEQFMAPAYNNNNNKRNSKRKTMDVVQGRMDEAYKIFKTMVKSEKPRTSQCSLYGQLIAHKLEALDDVERVVVMNDIDNLIFRATIKQMSMGRQSRALHSNNNPLQQ